METNSVYLVIWSRGFPTLIGISPSSVKHQTTRNVSIGHGCPRLKKTKSQIANAGRGRERTDGQG